MVVLSIVLNSYWFMLMVNMMIRTIKKLTATKENNEEKIELVKADALAEDADCGSSTQGSNIDGGEIVEENPSAQAESPQSNDNQAYNEL